MGLIFALSEYCNNYFHIYIIFKNINIIIFENWQGINPIGLSAALSDYNTILNKHKNVTIILKTKQEKSSDKLNGFLCPLRRLSYLLPK